MRILFFLWIIIGLSACRDTENLQHEADILKISSYLSQQGIVATQDSKADFFYFFYVENDNNYQPPRDWGLTVEVRYKAFLLDGTVVEDTGANTVKVPLDQSIYGWRLALPLMNRGERMLLLLPSRLAYGTESSTAIPANSVLGFEIELVEIYPRF
ncbi:MAG: FKBP-type peptidyl-prolyl cis-trans isomerase [Aureispira sp.]